MSAIVVRRATVDDAERIAALVDAAFAEYRGKLQPESGALAETTDSIARQLVAPAGGAVAWRMAGAGAIGEVVGAVLFKPQDANLYFGRLSVPPAARGLGVAGALIRFVEDEARRRGCAGVALGVRVTLPDNQRLFARHGYVEVSRSAHDGYAYPTSIEMRKQLAVGLDRLG
ncbi:MAG TPA: GNAT family N-acetyltransferase [Vineibacter sp.]|nr:GNAT family N-acetyltransferase [Vineibacter sp.]